MACISTASASLAFSVEDGSSSTRYISVDVYVLFVITKSDPVCVVGSSKDASL